MHSDLHGESIIFKTRTDPDEVVRAAQRHEKKLLIGAR